MNATTEPQPVCKCPATACRCRHSAVSDKDRDAAAMIRIGALNAVILGVDWAGLIAPPTVAESVLSVHEVARQALDALIAHGWGPRPTVAKEDLVDHVARIEAINAPVVNGAITLNAESMADALIPFLRECGIEVTDE